MKNVAQTTSRIVLAGIALGALLAAVPTQAYGYADPGTGTFVYQAVYAAFIGGAFYLRKLVQKFRGKATDQNR